MSENNMGNTKGAAKGIFQRNRVLVVVVVISLLIIGWMYISSSLNMRNVEQAAEARLAALVKQSEARQTETVRQSLTMLGIPMAWAIRREMMANNLDQVDQYVLDLVKQKGFEQIVVAKADGKIALASDRKNLGADFSSLYASSYLTAEKITVEEKAQGKWLLVVPIMGLSERLGTVAVDYQVPPLAVAQ